jgi:hypothetical protein
MLPLELPCQSTQTLASLKNLVASDQDDKAFRMALLFDLARQGFDGCLRHGSTCKEERKAEDQEHCRVMEESWTRLEHERQALAVRCLRP